MANIPYPNIPYSGSHWGLSGTRNWRFLLNGIREIDKKDPGKRENVPARRGNGLKYFRENGKNNFYY